MKAWILFTLVGSIWAAVVDNEKEVTLLYADPTVNEPISMAVKVDELQETISYHMEERGNMADTETLEDYAQGFAATRDAEEEGCFIRQLTKTLPEAIQELKQVAASGPQKNSGNVDLLAIPSEDLSDIVGPRLTDFCGEYTMYKLTDRDEEGNDLTQDEEDGNALSHDEEDDNALSHDEGADERHFFRFRRCRCFWFWFSCYNFVIVVPTGATLFFFFPFFG